MQTSRRLVIIIVVIALLLVGGLVFAIVRSQDEPAPNTDRIGSNASQSNDDPTASGAPNRDAPANSDSRTTPQPAPAASQPQAAATNQLANTGPADVLYIFAAASMVGATTHYLYTHRRTN